MLQTGRLEAMIKRCKLKGGDCPCPPLNCKAADELNSASQQIASEIRLLEHDKSRVANLRKWLNHKPCTVRDGWKMPEKPDGDYQACVVHEGDGWIPHWYSETESPDYIDFPPGESSWPFNENNAYGEDWERIGFEVV